MRPWIRMLAALAGAVALGCSSADGATEPSPDAGVPVANAPNGTYRCDGARMQLLDVAGQWVDAGDCAIHGGTASVLHWNGGGLSAGSAVLPGEPGTTQRRILAGGRNDAWFVSGREVTWTQHAMLFHWDGFWWTQLYDWARFAPTGVVSDPSGGAWVFGARQSFTGSTTYVTVASIAHVPATRDRWEEALPPQIGSGGHIVDMHVADDGTVWAVGQRAAHGEGVVVRRIASRWYETPFDGGVPTSVWSVSASDAWLTTSGLGVFHWDGAAWTNTWSAGYDTSPGRLTGFGWLTNGFHWNGAMWLPPDPSFPVAYDVAYLRPFGVSAGWPGPTQLLGIFGRGTPDRTYSEVWSYDGTQWTKDRSPFGAFIERTGGVLTAVAGTAPDDELWIAPVTMYGPQGGATPM